MPEESVNLVGQQPSFQNIPPAQAAGQAPNPDLAPVQKPVNQPATTVIKQINDNLNQQPRINSAPDNATTDNSNFSIRCQLMELNRSVERFSAVNQLKLNNHKSIQFSNNASGFNASSSYGTQLLNTSQQQQQKFENSVVNESTFSQLIDNKYNYYGKSKYRFQEYIESINPPIADPIQRPSTASNMKESPNKSNRQCALLQTKSQHDHPNNNQQINSLAMMDVNHDRQGLHQPTQNYFILFKDQKDNKANFKKTKRNSNHFQKKQVSKGKDQKLNPNQKVIFDPLFQSDGSKPKWILEKKVQRLEKQLNQLKKKEEHRHKLETFSSFEKKDKRIKLNGNVERMLNTLWP